MLPGVELLTHTKKFRSFSCLKYEVSSGWNFALLIGEIPALVLTLILIALSNSESSIISIYISYSSGYALCHLLRSLFSAVKSDCLIKLRAPTWIALILSLVTLRDMLSAFWRISLSILSTLPVISSRFSLTTLEAILSDSTIS